MGAPPVVGIVGSGPAAAAVEAALEDVDASCERIDGASASSVEVPVVTGPCGASVFDRAQRAVDGTWISIELGGVGSRPATDVDAAVSVLDADGGCFDCLRTRVAANADGASDADPRTTRPDARLAGAIAGWRVVSVLAGDDVVGRVNELPYVERRFLPVPGCACDRPREYALDRSDADASVEAVASSVEAAIDDRVGIVGEIGEAHSFPLPYYLATLCDTTGFSDTEASRHAAGVAADWTPALVKAVGEALERYGAGVYRESTFEVAPATSRSDAVRPSSFVCSSDYDPPDPSEPIPWYRGESLTDGRSVALPAEFVVFPPPERRHVPPITTGLGLWSSGVGALLSGLYEVVERDATMLSWYSTFEPLGLSVDHRAFATLERRAASEGLDVTPLLVTQDVDVPVVTVAVHREGDWPRFAVGSDADLDATRAAQSALEEALQNWMELRAMGPDRAAADESAIAHYAEFPHPARSLVEVETAVDVSAIGPTDPPSGSDELDAVVDRLAAADLEAYGARLTPRDVNALDLEVVRVLVPGAQPLFTGEPFFGDRARTVPRDLGFRPALDRPPHPYP